MKKFRPFMVFGLGVTVLILFSLLSGEEKEVRRIGPIINGITLEAINSPTDSLEFKKITDIQANWVALVPFAFTSVGSAQVHFDRERQWWGEKSEGIEATIRMAQSHHLNIMIKPHLWVRNQGWPGDFELHNEADWRQWEADYKTYILNFAQIAEDQQVPLFCIGTECRKVVAQRPHFWIDLITEVRKIYHGKLTYAANWDNYQQVKFWQELDFIGIDAYFPLSDEKTPEVSELNNAWKKVLNEMADLAGKLDKPILFTEYGYQSMDFCTKGHWDTEANAKDLNHQAQANAFQSIYEVFWQQPWFNGGFIWKWHTSEERLSRMPVTAYTPQNKPALEVIKNQFSRESTVNTTAWKGD